jgi:hypothetical protein
VVCDAASVHRNADTPASAIVFSAASLPYGSMIAMTSAALVLRKLAGFRPFCLDDVSGSQRIGADGGAERALDPAVRLMPAPVRRRRRRAPELFTVSEVRPVSDTDRFLGKRQSDFRRRERPWQTSVFR